MDRAAMKKMQDILEITHVVIFFFLDPKLFQLPETQDGAGLLLLEFPTLTHYFMFRQAFQNTSLPSSCSTSHPSASEVKLEGFLMNNILFFITNKTISFPSVPNLDKIASYIVSD